METKDKFWMGEPPTKCDICKCKIGGQFVDGVTRFGPWGNMCLFCHTHDGRGLGTGRGQHYQRQRDGRWKKVAG